MSLSLNATDYVAEPGNILLRNVHEPVWVYEVDQEQQIIRPLTHDSPAFGRRGQWTPYVEIRSRRNDAGGTNFGVNLPGGRYVALYFMEVVGTFVEPPPGIPYLPDAA